MSGTVSFAQIPPNLRIPLFAVEFNNSQAGTTSQQQRTLILGDTYATVPVALSFIPSVAFAGNLYGTESLIYQMIAAYLANDPLAEVYAIGFIHRSVAAAASAAMTVTGTATAAGTLALYIAGTPVPVGVNNGDTPTAIAANVAGAVNALITTLNIAASNAAGVVTLTCGAEGASQNNLDIRLDYYGAVNNEALPPGLTVAITGFAGGVGVPDLSGLDALIGDQNFDFIVCQYDDSYSLAALTTLMNNSSGRWAPTRQDYGHVFVGHLALPGTGDVGTAVTDLLTYAAAENDPHRTTWGLYGSPTPPWVINAAAAGQAAQSLRADPAQPLQTLQLVGVLAPWQEDQITKTSQNTLLSSGVAQLNNDDAGNTYILRAVTTYTTNAYGQGDTSYLDVETMYTLMAITRQLAAAIQTKFGRVKLADNGTAYGAGQPIVTPSVISSELDAQYALMELDGLVEDATAMQAATIVVRDSSDPSRVDILWAPYLVSGLRIVAVVNQFRLLSAAMLAGLTS